MLEAEPVSAAPSEIVVCTTHECRTSCQFAGRLRAASEAKNPIAGMHRLATGTAFIACPVYDRVLAAVLSEGDLAFQSLLRGLKL